jgi:hypothetical protein
MRENLRLQVVNHAPLLMGSKYPHCLLQNDQENSLDLLIMIYLGMLMHLQALEECEKKIGATFSSIIF